MNIRKISDNVTYIGGAFFSFYAVGGARPALIELGISQLAQCVADAFKEHIGKPPATLVALHSHYDHAGGAARLMDIFPNAELAASTPAAEKISGEEYAGSCANAMQAVNENPLFHEAYSDADRIVVCRPIYASYMLDHGSILGTGGDGPLQVIATPGHSKCSISLYHLRSGAMFVSDTCGVPLPSGRIWPTAFDDVDLYLKSLNLMLELRPKFLCPGHFVFFRDDRAIRFLEKSIAATAGFFATLNSLIDRLGSDEDAILAELDKEYGFDMQFIQKNVLPFGNRAMLRQALKKRNMLSQTPVPPQ